MNCGTEDWKAIPIRRAKVLTAGRKCDVHGCDYTLRGVVVVVFLAALNEVRRS